MEAGTETTGMETTGMEATVGEDTDMAWLGVWPPGSQ